jgi:hypothetical protein
MSVRPALGVTIAICLAAGTDFHHGLLAQTQGATSSRAAKASTKEWTPARTPWGDPEIAGVYTNDESGIPFERPAQFEGKRLADISEEELAELRAERSEEALERAPTLGGAPGIHNPVHWFENFDAQNSRAWLVVDPPDGRIPPMTPEGQRRVSANPPKRLDLGRPADSWLDGGLYDRCISRGVPGSMMPAIYGNAYQIHQGPGWVAIRYEMIHEARMIPLDQRPHVGSKIPTYMGDARAHWDGNTLVVETTNFKNESAYRGANGQTLRLIERFKPTARGVLEWSVTVDDPSTWTRPWTFAMNLTRKDESQQPFEYACHEGNYGLSNILSAARSAERAHESHAQ